jgi:plastocyanin
MTLKTIAAGTLLAFAVAACGGSAATGPPPPLVAATPSGPAASAAPEGNPTPITVKDFTLDPKNVTVSGQASLGVTNAGPTIHNVTIRDASGSVVAATKDLRTGQSEVLGLHLAAGSYTLFCSLPGHESLGIKGTLTVTR